MFSIILVITLTDELRMDSCQSATMCWPTFDPNFVVKKEKKEWIEITHYWQYEGVKKERNK
jgi:hypothetical protein